MKELVGNSANYFLIPAADGKFIPVAELIFTVSEPEYTANVEGLLRTRSIETLRFCAQPKGLRMMAEALEEFAAEAEAHAQRAMQSNADSATPPPTRHTA